MSEIVYKHEHKTFDSLKVGQMFTINNVPYIKISDSSCLTTREFDIRHHEKSTDGIVCMMPVNAVSLITGLTYTIEFYEDCVLDVTVTIGG